MSKPQPILSHMPGHVKKRIVDSAETETRKILRQCNKTFNYLVKLQYESLEFQWDSNCNEIKIRTETSKGHTQEVKYKSSGRKDELFPNQCYLEAAVEKFTDVLKNPMVSVNLMMIWLGNFYADEGKYTVQKRKIVSKMQEVLSSFKHKISVEYFVIRFSRDARDILHVLPFLKPKTLRCMELLPSQSSCDRRDVYDLDLTEVAETKQWKQLESIFLDRHILRLPIEKTKHFERLSYYSDSFGIGDIEEIVKNILRPDGWVFRDVACPQIDRLSVLQYFSRFERIPTDRHSIEFKTSRGDEQCGISTSNSCTRIFFFNVKKYQCNGKKRL